MVGSKRSAALRIAKPWKEKSRSRGEMSAAAKSRGDDDAMQNFVTQLATDRR
jgi:hypothetical protein